MNIIAVVSNNEEYKEGVKEQLSLENYLFCYPSIDQINENVANLIIFDLSSLPELRSKNLRTEFQIKTLPILVVINEDKIASYSCIYSADDFVLSNATAKEILLRIKSLFWKAYGINTEDIIQIDELIIDLAQHRVLDNFEPIDLTYMEFKLLQFLTTNKNRVYSRNYILERVWGYDYYGGARTVDVHIRRLRFKLGPKYGGCIETVRNVGYKFITD